MHPACSTEPGEERAGSVLRWVISLLDSGKSAEMRKVCRGCTSPMLIELQSTQRETEIRTKLNTMIKSALGDRRGSMMELAGLATAPAKQGRGYATALVKELNNKARPPFVSNISWLMRRARAAIGRRERLRRLVNHRRREVVL